MTTYFLYAIIRAWLGEEPNQQGEYIMIIANANGTMKNGKEYKAWGTVDYNEQGYLINLDILVEGFRQNVDTCFSPQEWMDGNVSISDWLDECVGHDNHSQTSDEAIHDWVVGQIEIIHCKMTAYQIIKNKYDELDKEYMELPCDGTKLAVKRLILNQQKLLVDLMVELKQKGFGV